MLALKDTSNYTQQHPEWGDSLKRKFDRLDNTHVKGTREKTREKTLSILNQAPNKLNKNLDRSIWLRVEELLGVGLSKNQIIDIYKSNNRILKLEKHKYWIAVKILMAAKRKKLLSLKKLYNLLIDNKNLEGLNKEIKRIALSLSKKPKFH